DDDRVELGVPGEKAVQRAHEIAADRAAHAAVAHLEQLLIGLDDEIAVDAGLAELVDDDRIAAAMILRQDAVQQRRLAGPEIAGQPRGWDAIAHGASTRRRGGPCQASRAAAPDGPPASAYGPPAG